MKKYDIWDLYQKMPEGWVLDEKTGSPLSGYTFITNGRSVLNGGRRALLLTRPLQKTLFTQSDFTQSDAQTNKVENEIKIKKKRKFENRRADFKVFKSAGARANEAKVIKRYFG
jgi:hypothetical protein